MLSEGTWATELEILGLSHLLKTDIHTFSGGQWISFSGSMINSRYEKASQEAIYLNHTNENHYDVVTSVVNNIQSVQSGILHSKKEESICKTSTAREKKLERQKMRYQRDEKYRTKAKLKSIEKYSVNVKHRENVKQRSTQKYKADDAHRKEMKRRSTDKYRVDQLHRDHTKRRSAEKYKDDEKEKEKY
jgi:hypothetical protein